MYLHAKISIFNNKNFAPPKKGIILHDCTSLTTHNDHLIEALQPNV